MRITKEEMVLFELADGQRTAAHLESYAGYSMGSASSVRPALYRLWHKGLVEREGSPQRWYLTVKGEVAVREMSE